MRATDYHHFYSNKDCTKHLNFWYKYGRLCINFAIFAL